MARTSKATSNAPATRVVSDEIFKQVCDSPPSLPGKEKWLTTDEDLRSFKCHNWAYAKPALLEVLERMKRA
jgi:hypothetical protein